MPDFHTLKNKIIEFLKSLPTIGGRNGRYALVYRASLDKQLINTINFDEVTNIFCVLFVHNLFEYGTLEDGRVAIVAVLEAAKDFISPTAKEKCNDLIRDYRLVIE